MPPNWDENSKLFYHAISLQMTISTIGKMLDFSLDFFHFLLPKCPELTSVSPPKATSSGILNHLPKATIFIRLSDLVISTHVWFPFEKNSHKLLVTYSPECHRPCFHTWNESCDPLKTNETYKMLQAPINKVYVLNILVFKMGQESCLSRTY